MREEQTIGRKNQGENATNYREEQWENISPWRDFQREASRKIKRESPLQNASKNGTFLFTVTWTICCLKDVLAKLLFIDEEKKNKKCSFYKLNIGEK